MIAVDTSCWIAFLANEDAPDVEAVVFALRDREARMPPAALSELLSDPKMPEAVAAQLKMVPMLEAGEGYWERAGALRAKVIARGRKARLPDALIAQSCIDHHAALLTRDRDFQVFQPFGLRLLPILR